MPEQDFKRTVEDYKEETKRHFDVVAEEIQTSIKVVAEAIEMTAEHLDRFEKEAGERFDRLEAELGVIRSVLGTPEKPNIITREEYAKLETRLSTLETIVAKFQTNR